MVKSLASFGAGRPPRGGRGLKFILTLLPLAQIGSSPSRGTWIEIAPEDVTPEAVARRPPRGGRGLKWIAYGEARNGKNVVPLAGDVD